LVYTAIAVTSSICIRYPSRHYHPPPAINITKKNTMNAMIKADIRSWIYPIINPATAISRPVKRSGSWRILDILICPQIIAGIAAKGPKNIKLKIPRIMLAIAKSETCFCSIITSRKNAYNQSRIIPMVYL